MTTSINIDRADLIAELKRRLPLAKKHDEKAKAAHKKAEAELLKKFHARCREALKWDYKTAKGHNFEAGVNWRMRDLPCPQEIAPTIERELAALELSKQQTFTISDSKYSTLWLCLMYDAPEERTVC